MNIALFCAQALLTFTVDGPGPVRFGYPLPVASLRRGLRVAPRTAQLQWRLLHDKPDPVTGRLWVELAVTGARGPVRLLSGGRAPADADGGDLLTVHRSEVQQPGRRVRRTQWRWSTGEGDERITTRFARSTEHRGERFDAGESWTRCSPDLWGRWLRVRISARAWRRAGVLPRSDSLARSYREKLVEAASWLRELPGLRGRGDYGRSGGVVTNLEYDTTLAFARLGLVAENAALREQLPSAESLPDDPELIEQMKAMGYIGGGDH